MNEAEKNMKCPQCGASLPAGALEGLCPACLLKQGAAADTGPEPMAFEPPTVDEMVRLFPQLEILELIGKGGMGAVYKARQRSLDRLVALKILPPQAASGPGFPERFNREARALARLSHPNIVAVHEFGQVQTEQGAPLPFFIMEFVDGLNLRQLEQTGKLSPHEALQIVPQICEALQFAHDEGVVHRDIKPENILVDKKGRVKIADFGIAKIIGREADAIVTETKWAIGTPHYMAPEQMEKPQSVDHRADIFSLGVVFYEMLTGELPLGKFQPPSRRVSVDVRLDDVVLRSLEKEPELRYQHASHIKTAVETIAGSPGGSSAAPAANADALAEQILQRGYSLSIRSCLSRGWKLVRANFWPLVGVTALVLALLGAAGSFSIAHSNGDHMLTEKTSIVALLAFGPLMGGLYLYYLRKIRGQPANVEVAFSGFSQRFLHLFLAGFVTLTLIGLGFVCLILPGIYLLVSWMFTFPLVIDKGLDFWPAMELSRRVIGKHWWKFLCFALVLALVKMAGVFALIVGMFVTAPIGLAALLYAYEDIFGGAAAAVPPETIRVGPSGTAVMPDTSGGPNPRPRLAGLAIAGTVGVVLILAFLIIGNASHHRRGQWIPPAPRPPEPRRTEQAADVVFGPITERVLEFTNLTRRALSLASGKYLPPNAVLDFGPAGTNALRSGGVDLYLSDEIAESLNQTNERPVPKLLALDWRMLMWFSPAGPESSEAINLDSVNLEAMRQALDNWRSGAGRTNDDPVYAGIMEGVKARGMQNHQEIVAGTNVALFETRDGVQGALQISGITDDPAGVKLRYKILEPASRGRSTRGKERKDFREAFSDRLNAAQMIGREPDRTDALARLATDAAKAGDVETAKNASAQITQHWTRDQIMADCARALVHRGLRKQAIDMALTIGSRDLRDQTLSDLAR